MKRPLKWIGALAALALVAFAMPAAAQQKKPNILIIWGDDIGLWNVSAYNQGAMALKRGKDLTMKIARTLLMGDVKGALAGGEPAIAHT